MKLTVNDVYNLVDQIAPFDTQESWDNSGLLIGSRDHEVKGILCALDLNRSVLDQALSVNANLIVTHHPIMFSGRKNLREDDPEGKLICEMIRRNIALISAHTNYDVASGGVNDCLAKALALTNIEAIEADGEALLRIGNIRPCTLKDFADSVQTVLGDVVRVYGKKDRIISRVAVCGGAGGEYARLAQRAGADAYVTGEMRYHDSIDLAEEGFCSLHAGHDATERIAIKPLRDGLQNHLNALQYNVKVFLSNMGVVE